MFNGNPNLVGIDMNKFVDFVIKKQKDIRILIKKRLMAKIEGSLQIGNGLLKVLSHIQDEKAFTKAIFDSSKGKKT